MGIDTYVRIKIYWDEQVPGDHRWAYRAYCSDPDGEEFEMESGRVEIRRTATLDDAIDAACYELDVPLTHDDFGCEPHVDGGYAEWNRP